MLVNKENDIDYRTVVRATLNLGPLKVVIILACYATNIICIHYVIGKSVGQLEYLGWMICSSIILSSPFLAADRAHLVALGEKFKGKANRRLFASLLIALISVLTTQFTIMTLRDESVVESSRNTPVYKLQEEIYADLSQQNLNRDFFINEDAAAIQKVQNKGRYRSRIQERTNRSIALIEDNEKALSDKMQLLASMEKAEEEGDGSAYAKMMNKNKIWINILFFFLSIMLDLIPYMLVSSHISRELDKNDNQDFNYNFDRVAVPN